MDARESSARLLAAAGARLGRPVTGMDRGGASDASHFAASIPITVDGLGPRGGGAHAPNEFVLETSLRSRAEVALAIVDAALARLSANAPVFRQPSDSTASIGVLVR